MTTNADRLCAMEAFVERIGAKLADVGIHLHSNSASLTLYGDQMPPSIRATLIAECGEPRREKRFRTDAEWSATDARRFSITCYSWPWDTCWECNQPIGEPVKS